MWKMHADMREKRRMADTDPDLQNVRDIQQMFSASAQQQCSSHAR
jgi:hypothetical protein